MLYLDRYRKGQDGWMDLATGRRVEIARGRRPEAAVRLFGTGPGGALIDLATDGQAPVLVWEAGLPRAARVEVGRIAGVTDALDAARHGRPRLVAPDDLRGFGAWEWRLLAREARLRGWVPVALRVLATIGPRAVVDGDGDLHGRTLLVCVDRPPAPDEFEVLDALAGLGARPHVVAYDPRPRAGGAPHAPMRRTVDAPTADFDSRPEQEARRRWAVIRALVARDAAALGLARVALAEWLARAHRVYESRAELHAVPVEAVADGGRARLEALLLRESLAGATRALDAQGREPGGAIVEDFVGVLEICRDVDDDRAALARVGAFLCDRLQAASVAFVVREAGQARVVAAAGRCQAAPDAALRAIDSGAAVPAPAPCGPAESAYPVRQAADVIGAVWCRWSSGIPIAAEPASALLKVAATALGPSLRAVSASVEEPGRRQDAMPEIIGSSDAIRAVRDAVSRAAASPFPVLIEGESGAGKELVARAVHRLGARRLHAFEAINCAALADELVEAELFGHTRGAYTGAAIDRAGLFEAASGGTLFLDEVAELGARVQAKLLRVLQEGEVRRLGEGVVRQVDVRIVAATNRPLAAEVDAGRFRADLRFRLDVIRIAVPPLRDRLEDLPALAQHAWRRLAERSGCRAELGAQALAALGRYDWPGNVRELQNVLAAVMVAAPPRGRIGAGAVATFLPGDGATGTATLDAARRAFEVRFVRAAIARHGGRLSPAARDLGITRQGLAKLVARLGLDRRMAT
ncbi:MAG: sigma 54-interacting transcriptional regulator [Vicinamibacterales bacterium]